MFSAARWVIFATLAISCANAIVYPIDRGVPNSNDNTLGLDDKPTDSGKIIDTAASVNQAGGATGDAPPNLPPPETAVTAVDGNILSESVAVSSGNFARRGIFPVTRIKRTNSGYEQVFSGTGTGPNDRDGSIQGTAYLTYTVVPNSTYSVDPCLDFCDRVSECVFANLYYEFNNDLLDDVFSEKSNLKCAVYGDVHTANEKTNLGGQQLKAPPSGLTYMQQSSGWAKKSFVDPSTPDGFEPVFGPLDGANNAPGYMGFAFLDRYDVQACADLCNTRGYDGQGGACAFFNIWRAVITDKPRTYTCSMYYLPADASTAVNYGQGDLKVTESRGYRRTNLVADGNFEAYQCADGSDFCYTTTTSNWVGVSPAGGTLDATIFHYKPYAHSGNGVVILGSASGSDIFSGTLKPAQPLHTVAGKTYKIQWFASSTYSGPDLEKDAFLTVNWNGQPVRTFNLGYSQWTYYEVSVVARGNDELAFTGGKLTAYTFLDDVAVYLA
ncbi:hypothetical protein E1B28_008347 [Marasmius oreades]|uniref:Fruit-body specific protein a n=1 Tax=Marasmius oreades TaxID=181124 RepID=A0A9P7RYT4_9AGAR|nr:uncharacterized protein E1B28_008347 [Marasmius oreades]KAG7091958.1 hypothetical protein E1B28_008347 [Marasmius oreades]